MIDPAIERRPLILRLEDGRLAVYQIALVIILDALLPEGVDKRCALRPKVFGGRFPNSLLLLISELLGADLRREVGCLADIGEERLQLEVLLLRDPVELVVVAPRA